MKQESVHYQYIYLARISIHWIVVINIFVNLIIIIAIMQSKREELQKQRKENKKDSLDLRDISDFISWKVYKNFPTNVNI